MMFWRSAGKKRALMIEVVLAGMRSGRKGLGIGSNGRRGHKGWMVVGCRSVRASLEV